MQSPEILRKALRRRLDELYASPDTLNRSKMPIFKLPTNVASTESSEGVLKLKVTTKISDATLALQKDATTLLEELDNLEAAYSSALYYSMNKFRNRDVDLATEDGVRTFNDLRSDTKCLS